MAVFAAVFFVTGNQWPLSEATHANGLGGDGWEPRDGAVEAVLRHPVRVVAPLVLRVSTRRRLRFEERRAT